MLNLSFNLKRKKAFSLDYPLSIIHDNSVFNELPKSVQHWMMTSTPHAVISDHDKILILFSSPYLFSFNSAPTENPADIFLNYLYSQNYIENDVRTEMKKSSCSLDLGIAYR